jgi:hypothetical protein
MPKFEFCIPTAGKAVPAGPEWFHEIKYDGYRLRIERDGDSVRLITRGGYNWTRRFPWIAEAALRNRTRQFVIDGEASCFASMACPTSMPCTRGNTMRRCNSAPLERPALSRRTVTSLDQGEEPAASPFRPSKRILRVTVWIYINTAKEVGDPSESIILSIGSLRNSGLSSISLFEVIPARR